MMIMFGRRTRTLLPISHSLLKTPSDASIHQRAEIAKEKQAEYYNRHARSRPQLHVGQTVRFKEDNESDWRKGQITDVLPYRSYQIQTEDGAKRRRTSRHVRASREPPVILEDTSPSQQPPPAAAVRFPITAPVAAAPQQCNDKQYVTRSGRCVIKPQRYRDS